MAYHVPSATDPKFQFLNLGIVSNFRHINDVYNLYFDDQMVVLKFYGPIIFSEDNCTYDEIGEILWTMENGLNIPFEVLFLQMLT